MTRRLSILAVLIAVAAIVGAVVWTVAAVPRRAREMATAAASAAFGREVTTRRVSGNPWSGLVLEDVVVGEPIAPRLPTEERKAPVGPRPPAILTVRRMTLHFDPLLLLRDVWRGSGAAASVSQITLDEPVLVASRNRAGAWNIGALFPQLPGLPRQGAFAGRVIILHGTVSLLDAHRFAPQTFQARFEDLNGTADFAKFPRVALQASFVEERGERRVPVRLRGSLHTTDQSLDLDLRATGVDGGAWGPYLITTPVFRLVGGQFDITAHILRTVTGGRAVTDYQARIAVREGRAVFPQRGAVLTNVRGSLAVSNGVITTDGLSGSVNGSTVHVRGEISLYGSPRLDLAVRTPGVDLSTLRRLIFPGAQITLAGVASGEARIVGSLKAPRIDGRIQSAQGQLGGQRFEGASGDFALYGQTLSVAGTGRAAGGSLSGTAWWQPGAPDFLLDVTLAGADGAAVARWAPPAVHDIGGRISGSISARRQGSELAIAGRASVAQPRIAQTPLDSLDAAFRVDRGVITLDYVRARQGATVALANGSISQGGRLSLSAHASGIDLATLPAVPADIGLRGRADFSGRVGGTLAAPTALGNVQIAGARLGGLAFDTAGGRLGVASGRLSLDGMTARTGRSRYWATGTVHWRPETHLSLTLETERGSAARFAQLAGLPFEVTGSVDGRVHVEGSPARPSVAGTLSLLDATIGGQTVDEATAAFRSDGIRLTVEQASLRRRASAVELAGVIDRRTGLNLSVSAQGFNLRDLTLPPLGGTRLDGHVDLTGRISGPTSAPVVSAAASSANLRINGIRFDQATGEVSWEARTLRLNPLALRVGAERYEISGEMRLAGPPSAALTATVTDGRLSTLLGLANIRLGLPLDGTISGLTTLEGPLANPAARLDLRLSDGRFGTHRLIEGHADLTLREGSVTIQEFQLRPVQGTIVAEGRLNLRGESQVEVSGADLELDMLRPLFRLRRPLLGRLNFTTQLTGTLASPEIGFAAEVTRGGIEGATFDSLVANAFYRDGLLQIQQALLVQSGNKLRASGSVPFNPALLRFEEGRPIDLRLTLADVNLGLLRLATDRIEEAVGPVEGEVRIDGTVGTPRVAGRLLVQDGRVRVRGLQTPIEALRLDLRFDESTIRIAEATARLGAGVARLEGAARIASLARPGSAPAFILIVSDEAPLVLTGSDLRVVVPPYIDARAAGTLRMVGTLGDPRRPPTLDGRVSASDGVITVAAPGTGAPSTAPIVFRGIRFEAGRNLAVQVGGLRLDLQPGGVLTLTGTPRAPMLEGTVAAQQGKVLALGTLFDLREGTATFFPHQGLRPNVFALAETQVGATRVFLTVRGTAPDALAPLELRSDPDLPREQIVALLGQQAGLTRLVAGDVEGALREQIGRLLFGQVSLGIGRAVGLTELVIEYDFERPLGLRAGRLLLNDLYWTVSTTFTTPVRWITALEYRFARGWQLALRLDSDRRREAIVYYSVSF